MKPKLILSTTIAIVTLGSCLFAEEVKYPPINPALTYWQSAALMPDLKGEKAALLHEAVFGKKPLDDPKVRELLSESDQSMKMFAKAATSSAPCDWGLAMDEGPELSLPHLSKMRELCSLAILKADVFFAEGKTREGVHWLLLADRAGRDAGAGDLVISVLVEDSIESTIIYSAGSRCLGWDDATRKIYAKGLDASPPHRLQDAFHGETVFIDWVERRLQSPDPEDRRKLRDILLSSSAANNEPASGREAEMKQLEEQLTPSNSPAFIAELRDINSRTQAAMGKPWKESHAELEAIKDEAQRGNVLLKLTCPGFESVNRKRFQIATLRTMLNAALQYGPKLDEATTALFKDAFDGEPLVLKKADDGSLTLTTARKYGTQAIELKLGNEANGVRKQASS
jgi:hypothetical protein